MSDIFQVTLTLEEEHITFPYLSEKNIHAPTDVIQTINIPELI